VELEYLVYRFFGDGDNEEALVGVSGPFWKGQDPYYGYPGTFSTFNEYSSKTPEEHVEWVHTTMVKKGVYTGLFPSNVSGGKPSVST
jgi:hypothetical protein